MEGDDETCVYNTGLKWAVYKVLEKAVLPYYNEPRATLGGDRLHNLPKPNQLVMTLMMMRLDLQETFISKMIGYTQPTVSYTFHKIVDVLYARIGWMVRMPDREGIYDSIPPHFKQYFPRLTQIIDCFEIFTDRPGKLLARQEVFSNYKKHSTVKFLISITPNGAVSFLAPAYGGRASDIFITRDSGYINLHKR